ncbi:hypothetical protein E2C01_028923 [Portunus trituberculatus]|uniref:Uncharacterized protein n=1 Tax=Portunus trituberculatus TaxID=210409 RepID=A0A5B7EQD6_PORTR|nr:hypothetical protein [Portunus trituberculatus]
MQGSVRRRGFRTVRVFCRIASGLMPSSSSSGGSSSSPSSGYVPGPGESMPGPGVMMEGPGVKKDACCSPPACPPAPVAWLPYSKLWKAWSCPKSADPMSYEKLLLWSSQPPPPYWCCCCCCCSHPYDICWQHTQLHTKI